MAEKNAASEGDSVSKDREIAEVVMNMYVHVERSDDAPVRNVFRARALTPLPIHNAHRNCCIRCAASFTSLKYSLHSLTVAEIAEKLGIEADYRERRGCCICFEMLGNNDEVIQKVTTEATDRIVKDDYQVEAIDVGIEIPATCILRRMMIRLNVYSCLADGYGEERLDRALWDSLCPIDTKELLKKTIQTRIKTILQKVTCSKDATAQTLGIQFTFSGLETDPWILKNFNPRNNHKKRSRGGKKKKERKNESRSYVAKDVRYEVKDVTPVNASHYLRRRPLQCPRAAASFKISRRSVYIYGRYMKYLRGMTQTPWIVDGKRRGETSLEEEITKVVMPHFGSGARGTFQSGGREDMDVRMLGDGRPFLLEIANAPKIECSDAACRKFEVDIVRSSGGAVAVRDLKYIADPSEVKAALARMKSAAESKRKHYCAVVWVDRNLSTDDLDKLAKMHNVTLRQRTPLRVAHRRSMAVREKTIFSMTPERINDRWLRLDIVASAGTYIKEFVHGDLGRTQPNVGSLLGCQADIIQLDVTKVVVPTCD
eukprot:g1787.t1